MRVVPPQRLQSYLTLPSLILTGWLIGQKTKFCKQIARVGQKWAKSWTVQGSILGYVGDSPEKLGYLRSCTTPLNPCEGGKFLKPLPLTKATVYTDLALTPSVPKRGEGEDLSPLLPAWEKGVGG